MCLTHCVGEKPPSNSRKAGVSLSIIYWAEMYQWFVGLLLLCALRATLCGAGEPIKRVTLAQRWNYVSFAGPSHQAA